MNLGLPELVLILVVIGFALLATVFWIWMLVDCATKEPNEGNNKIVWVIIICLLHFVGALIYLIVRRPKRIAETGK
jgi:hypothetical protein